VKTPSTENLHLASELFPEVPVVILVRDGRAAAESLHTGFRRSYSGAIKTWREGARRALAARDGLLVVKYEDLVAEPEKELTRILDFAGLDRGRFDFDAARRLPVFGSSFVKVDGGLTWEPQEKPDDFDPAERFASWTRRRHQRFNWLAGREQTALGYEIDDNDSDRGAGYNLALDAAAPLMRLRDALMHLRWRVRSGNLRQ
jgi:hypothetical protein